MAAQARSSKRSCYDKNKCYWNCQCSNNVCCLIASHLFDREGDHGVLVAHSCEEKYVWWRFCSFGNSYTPVTQKNIFSTRFRQMTKYCVMRECENILSGYLYVCDYIFSLQDGIYGFKFPRRILKIPSRDLTSFSSFSLS
jgi:hypothetical protein